MEKKRLLRRHEYALLVILDWKHSFYSLVYKEQTPINKMINDDFLRKSE